MKVKMSIKWGFIIRITPSPFNTLIEKEKGNKLRKEVSYISIVKRIRKSVAYQSSMRLKRKEILKDLMWCGASNLLTKKRA